jgi:hypothetical protein
MLPAGVAIVVAAVAAGMGSADAKGRHISCARSGTTVLQTRTARVFDRKERRGAFRVHVVYACRVQHGKVVRIGDLLVPGGCSSQDCTGFHDFHLSGPYVSFVYADFRGQLAGTFDQVTSVDLRTGQVVRHWSNGGCPNVAITASVLGDQGSLAWVVESSQCGGDPSNFTRQVWRLDRVGAEMVDSGRDIDPSSLALAGSTFYWTSASGAHSATLR